MSRSRRGTSAARVAEEYDLGDLTVRLVPDPPDIPGEGWTVYLDGVESSHLDPSQPERLDFEYMRTIGSVVDAVAPAGQPLDTVHVGGCAATMARYIAATRPGSHQVVVEIDAALVDLVRRRFPTRGIPRLKWAVGDAVTVLPTLREQAYDLVIRDAFVGREVPPELRGGDWIAAVRGRLRPGGWYVCNLADAKPLLVARREAATLLAHFPQVVLLAEAAVLRGRRTANLILAAGDTAPDVAHLTRLAAAQPVPVRVLDEAAVRAFAAGREPFA